jgi:putative DNA primase/helicase
VTNVYGEYAFTYHHLGYSPIPLPKGKKAPVPDGWTGREGLTASGADIQEWIDQDPDRNIAIRLPKGVIGIDVDDYGTKVGGQTMAKAVETLGRPGSAGRLTSRYPDDKVSGIRLFRVPEDTVLVSQFSAAGLGKDVEIIQFHHRYAVAPGSIHPDTGRPYCWINAEGVEDALPPVSALPKLPQAWIEALTPQRAEAPDSEHDHSAYDAMDQGTQNKVQAYMERTLAAIYAELDAMKTWPAGHRDENGHGWEEGVLQRTLRLAQFVKADWNTLTTEEVLRDLRKHLPQDADFTLASGLGKFVRALNNPTIAGAWYPIKDEVDLFEGVEDRSPKGPDGTGTQEPDAAIIHGDSQFAVEFPTKGIYKLDEDGKPKGILPYDTAMRLAKIQPIAKQVLTRGRTWWAYRDGVWGPNDEIVRGSLARTLKNHYKPSDVAPVEDILATFAPELRIEAHEDFINLRNGMLEWRTGELHEHNQSYQSTVQIPHSWNAEAECPTAEAWLEERLPEAGVRLAWELIAVSLYSGNPIQRAGLLYGVGKSGKSTFLEMIQGLLGRRNVAALSPHDMSKTVFATHSLLGKQANIVTDIDPTKVAETAIFKRVVASESIQAQQKNKPEFTFAPFCNHLFSANQVPRTADRTSAWTRRFAILRFESALLVPRVIERFDRILLREAEGIIAKAVRILPELLAQGDFSVIKDDQDEFEAATDFTTEFWEDAITITGDGGDFVTTNELAQVFDLWCGQRRIRHQPPFADVELRLRDHPAVDKHRKRATGAGRASTPLRGWKGLKVNPEYKLSGVPGIGI